MGPAFWSQSYENAVTFFDQGVPADEAATGVDIDKYPDAALTLPTIVAARDSPGK